MRARGRWQWRLAGRLGRCRRRQTHAGHFLPIARSPCRRPTRRASLRRSMHSAADPARRVELGQLNRLACPRHLSLASVMVDAYDRVFSANFRGRSPPLTRRPPSAFARWQDDDEGEWEAFVARNSNTGFFHQCWRRRVVEAALGHRCLLPLRLARSRAGRHFTAYPCPFAALRQRADLDGIQERMAAIAAIDDEAAQALGRRCRSVSARRSRRRLRRIAPRQAAETRRLSQQARALFHLSPSDRRLRRRQSQGDPA